MKTDPQKPTSTTTVILCENMQDAMLQAQWDFAQRMWNGYTYRLTATAVHLVPTKEEEEDVEYIYLPRLGAEERLRKLQHDTQVIDSPQTPVPLMTWFSEQGIGK